MDWRAIARQARKKKYFLSVVARDSTTFSGARELIGEMTVQKLPYPSSTMANSLQIGAAGWGWVENPSELL